MAGHTGYYIKPTILKGTNDMKVFQEEIFGPVTTAPPLATAASPPRHRHPPDRLQVTAVTTFKTVEEGRYMP